MSNLEKAISLASQAHFGQSDKAGQPYILHPLRVMMRLAADDERIVAVLHDVVEDSNITLDDLLKLGFSEEIVSALDCLTKREGEPYSEFLDRVSTNALARAVKIEDIRDNLDPARLALLPELNVSRVEKYHSALRSLSALA